MVGIPRTDQSKNKMAARTITNAAMLLMMSCRFNFANQLVLPNEKTMTNYQSVLKTNKDGTEIQNGIKYDDKTSNRVKSDIEVLEYIEADEDAEKDIARRKAILESNVKNDYNIPSKILIADRDDISKYRYNIDANTDKENNKLKREGGSTSNVDISELIKNQPRKANKRRNSAISAAYRVENDNYVGIDVNEKTKNENANDIATLKNNRRSDSATRILRSNTVQTKISTGSGFLNENTKNSDSIMLKFEAPKGFYIDTSKRRFKRDIADYDDDLYIWDDCEGKEHLAYIDGVLKCVEMTLENRNFGTLTNCPAGKRRVFLQNSLILCLPRKKRRV